MLTRTAADRLSAGKLDFISIVIPVYNQEGQISEALERIRRVLDETFVDYEMVAVDDGSTDGTYNILQKEQQFNSRLKVISYKPNRGKGFAVQTGVLNSRGSIVLFTDGDLDIAPTSIREYLSCLSSCDIVIASKRHPQSSVKTPRSRLILSRAFSLLVRILTGIPIKDTQAGMKAGKGDVMRTIFKIMVVKRYAFDVELLTIASLMGLKIVEMPVTIELSRRFRSKDIIRMFIDVVGISYRYRTSWYTKRLSV